MKVTKTRFEFYKESLRKARNDKELKDCLIAMLLGFSYNIVSHSEDFMNIRRWIDEAVEDQI